MLQKFFYCLISFTMLFSLSCSDDSYSKLYFKNGDVTKLILNLSMSQSKTILPDIDMEPETYIITGNGPDGDTFDASTDESSIEITGLIFGDWTINVEARNADDTIIGEGEGSTTILSGETSSIEIVVAPLDGVGTLDLTVNWDEEHVEYPEIEAQLIPQIGSTIDLTFLIDGGTATYSNSALDTGYYTLTFSLFDDGVLCAGAVEVVRIVKDQTTEGIIDLDLGLGGIQINITLEMNDPIEVLISGEEDSITSGESMTVNASAPGETVAIIYAWYINGTAYSTDNPYTFGSDLPVGMYRLDVTAFTADGKRGGSATHIFMVTE